MSYSHNVMIWSFFIYFTARLWYSAKSQEILFEWSRTGYISRFLRYFQFPRTLLLLMLRFNLIREIKAQWQHLEVCWHYIVSLRDNRACFTETTPGGGAVHHDWKRKKALPHQWLFKIQPSNLTSTRRLEIATALFTGLLPNSDWDSD